MEARKSCLAQLLDPKSEPDLVCLRAKWLRISGELIKAILGLETTGITTTGTTAGNSHLSRHVLCMNFDSFGLFKSFAIKIFGVGFFRLARKGNLANPIAGEMQCEIDRAKAEDKTIKLETQNTNEKKDDGGGDDDKRSA